LELIWKDQGDDLFGKPGNARECGKGEKSCQGKLSIAYFIFGAMSEFSRLLLALFCPFK